ncbi:hypothetical protein HB665_15470 [Bacillus paranthracis]|uniref:hypothetical protein n=1 Tax=Bacillus cereus group TaxID=86661 RepID=UPI001444754F|nr:hypothetical protein [Bacillus paranthracis]NKX25566.1 hypothetical protein [Bacillus paranthracis]
MNKEVSKEKKIIVFILLGLLLIFFLGVQSRNYMYGEESSFATSSPLHVIEQKKELENQIKRTERYYNSINYVINKLKLDDIGEIEGLTDKEGISQEEFLAEFFASTLLENDEIFLAHIDPNSLLNDKDFDLSNENIKKIKNLISRKSTINEVYLQSKTIKDNSNFEVVVLISYQNKDNLKLKLRISKLSNNHHNGDNVLFMVNTSLSDINKQLKGQ